ncbi:hypothetical protein PRIPAC_86662 [Pristionchus pacificus]|uniref:Uncharacterized protein n=1 Tax=Pristionchus pacificus TaxID=54126 RepID=A0A2A6BMR2_PRIPA|nr:hypothetical protein PRIPAC_86662 [Pristionchus pacificus]|eukprot:PDM67195.1 hypothetical protein PRIPAC_48612 [Pristionchus pacificus]
MHKPRFIVSTHRSSAKYPLIDALSVVCPSIESSSLGGVVRVVAAPAAQRRPLISRVIAHAPITAPELFPPNWFGGVVVLLQPHYQ